MIIRIIYATVSSILFILLISSFSIAQASMDRLSMEMIYLARDGHLTTIQQKSFNELTPEEQERIIKNYREYQRLPQGQQRKLKNRYKRWQKMSPGERQKLKRNYKRFKRLPPKKRLNFQ